MDLQKLGEEFQRKVADLKATIQARISLYNQALALVTQAESLIVSGTTIPAAAPVVAAPAPPSLEDWIERVLRRVGRATTPEHISAVMRGTWVGTGKPGNVSAQVAGIKAALKADQAKGAKRRFKLSGGSNHWTLNQPMPQPVKAAKTLVKRRSFRPKVTRARQDEVMRVIRYVELMIQRNQRPLSIQEMLPMLKALGVKTTYSEMYNRLRGYVTTPGTSMVQVELPEHRGKAWGLKPGVTIAEPTAAAPSGEGQASA